MTINLTDDEALAVVSVLKLVPDILANHPKAPTLLSLTESARQKVSTALLAAMSSPDSPRVL